MFLSPEVIASLSSMELRAKFVVEGFLTGLHKSPYHGFSVEFSEHRQYMPGDDLKRLDWKVYGKTGKYFIKQYEEETNLKAYILLDASNSMGYKSTGTSITKLAYASYLGAALSYLLIQQRDAVGLAIYDSDIRTFLRPRSTMLYARELMKELEHARPQGITNTAGSLHMLAERIDRRGLIILLSDCFDEPEHIIGALKHFRHKGHEVLVLHILDPLERTFDFPADAVFQDLESDEKLSTQPWHIKKAYQDAMQNFLILLKEQCRNNLIDYLLLETSTPFDKGLATYLRRRAMMR